jgi:hypothetical protein
VVSILGMLGGLDPWSVFYVYTGTASLALAVGGVSILASTLARRPREAIVAAYALEVAWLILPPMVAPIVHYLAWPFNLLQFVNGLLMYSNPYFVWSMLQNVSRLRGMGMGPWRLAFLARQASEVHWLFLGMAGLQTLLGLICVELAVRLLRPLRAGDGLRAWSWAWRVGRRRSRAVVPSRPGCGEAPMFWKEWYAAPRGGLAWLVSRPVVLFLGTLLGCYLFEVARPALFGFMDLGGSGNASSARAELNGMVRTLATWLAAGWVLAVASAAAVSVTSEREDDTWTSLTATLLSGAEVVRAKVLGAIWGARRLAWAVLALIGVGVLAGAVHPIGAAVAVLVMAVSGAFASALGVYISLGAKTSTRALVSTVLLLAALNLVLMLAAAGIGRPNSTLWLMTLTPPWLEYASLLSYDDALALWRGGTFQIAGSRPVFGPEMIGVVLTGLTLYGLAALVLTGASAEAYDRVAGRARRIRVEASMNRP